MPDPLRTEITPKNILMIGPTGVGKTEIARRLARLADAPFIKVEATKFTEVGYVGRDVDTIIRDLVDISVKQTRETEMKKVAVRAQDAAEDRILDILVPPSRDVGFATGSRDDENATRQKFRKKLREGELDDKEVDVEVSAMSPSRGGSGSAPKPTAARGRGSKASSTRSSAASIARWRTFAVSASRVSFTATSTRSLMMESTSRPT